jgi:hypothetical protein
MMTVQATDAAKALTIAVEVLRQAIGSDARPWDVAGAAATVAPVGAAAPVSRIQHGWPLACGQE